MFEIYKEKVNGSSFATLIRNDNFEGLISEKPFRMVV